MNIYPDIVTYTMLISGFCKLGKWQEAMGVLTDMMEQGISLNVVAFNSLIDALCKEGIATGAHKLLDVMIQRGTEPDVITYNSLMDGYVVGQLDEAIKVFDLML